jgi:hypothetical protein
MKLFLPFAFIIAGAGLMQASTIEMISFDLSSLHPGSTLSGTFTLPDSPIAGDTAPVVLSFSDPADYSPTSLMATITIGSGTPSGFTVLFSELTFTNLSGSTGMVDTKDVDLTGFGFANCTAFPCTASGGLQDRSPSVFKSTYTISPVATPEPSYALSFPILLMGMVFARRLVRPA